MMKKKKYESNKGLTGCGINYAACGLSKKEAAISILSGAAIGYIVFCIFFGVHISGLIFVFIGAIFGQMTGKKYFQKKRCKNLHIQFRDFLESVSSSLSAGQNISGAFKSAYDDLELQYGRNSMMASEVRLILDRTLNGCTIEESLSDFAIRSADKDIMTFSETFKICNRTGGNMRDVISVTYRTLSEKMQINSEIETLASKSKNDLRIMVCMPLLIVPMLGTIGDSGNTSVTIIVRLIGAIIILASYIAGSKITEIKI